MGWIDQERQDGNRSPAGWSGFETFPAAAHLLTASGMIVETNPAFERMFGGPRTAFHGRRLTDLTDGTVPMRRLESTRILREASARGSWEGTLRNRGDDGRRFTTRAHVFPARVDGRRYFVCIQEETGPSRLGRSPDAGLLRPRRRRAAG